MQDLIKYKFKLKIINIILKTEKSRIVVKEMFATHVLSITTDINLRLVIRGCDCTRTTLTKSILCSSP